MKKDTSEVLVVEDDAMTSSVILEFMIFDKIPVDLAHSFHDVYAAESKYVTQYGNTFKLYLTV